jgi:hypothetical protein
VRHQGPVARWGEKLLRLNDERVAELKAGHQTDGNAHAISATQPGPLSIVSRKPCSLTIAETRLRPRPDPKLLRLLSER